MHNVKRVHQSPEAARARKQKEQAKIAEYLVLTNTVLSRVHHHPARQLILLTLFYVRKSAKITRLRPLS